MGSRAYTYCTKQGILHKGFLNITLFGSMCIKQPLIEQNLEQVSAGVNKQGLLLFELCFFVAFVPAVTNAENRKKIWSGMNAQFILI